jgi:hypothetical protein
MTGTQVITVDGRVRMIGVPAELLMGLHDHILRFVEGVKFCAGLPKVLPAVNVEKFLDVLVEMLADEVVASPKGRVL